MTKIDTLSVTSNIARDLLQSSGVFTHERLVVWEYVSNGLDYVDPGVHPVVQVKIEQKCKKIICADNGRGMGISDLQNFFTMHGKNLDRQERKSVRGFFGTGKSAAFGIAGTMRVTTVKDNKRSIVELRKDDIKAAEDSGSPIPLTILASEEPCTLQNGTTIEIENIHLKHIDQKSVIDYIERHLSQWGKDGTVFVNNHECQVKEPPLRDEHIFLPSGDSKDALGDTKLFVRTSTIPLDKDLQGISIFSNGVLYETTLAGSEGKDLSNYIFGSIEIPSLADEGDSKIPAFDLSRRMQLNKKNPLVQKIHAFIGIHVEEVRKKLVKEEKERRKTELAEKLQTEADKIAELINKDFADYREKLEDQEAKVAGSTDKRKFITKATNTEEDLLTEGGNISAAIDHLVGGPAEGDTASPPTEEGERDNDVEPRKGASLVEADDGPKKAKESRGKRQHTNRAGGFNVEFREAGEDEARAEYESETRTIYINLAHPQLQAALVGTTVEDVKFRRLAYEVAFSEYAIGLVHELNAINYYYDIEDAIYEVRETLNRVSRAAAPLYAAQ